MPVPREQDRRCGQWDRALQLAAAERNRSLHLPGGAPGEAEILDGARVAPLAPMSHEPGPPRQTGPVRIELTTSPRGRVIALNGRIDEHTDLVKAIGKLGDPLLLDLAGITFINSLGIREWIRMLRFLEGQRFAVRLLRVAQPLVVQMSMIPEAVTGAVVESFYAPYRCDECAGEHAQCLGAEETRSSLDLGQLPARSCPECGGVMQLDEDAGRYLAFLGPRPRRRSRPPEPAAPRLPGVPATSEPT